MCVCVVGVVTEPVPWKEGLGDGTGGSVLCAWLMNAIAHHTSIVQGDRNYRDLLATVGAH